MLVVRRVDNFIQRINPYPVDKIGLLSNQNLELAQIHPLDRDTIRVIKLSTLRTTEPWGEGRGNQCRKMSLISSQQRPMYMYFQVFSYKLPIIRRR